MRTANEPEEGLLLFREWSPDLVVTDLMMPSMSGVEVCRAIRMQSTTPVLVLSVRDHERSKVEALDAGADDYVTKPFSIQELLARVRAHLRRAPERTTAAIETGDFMVDVAAHSITVQGKPIHLTPKEFDLLLHLARQAGKVITHRALLTAVWGAQSAHQPEYLRVFVGSCARSSKPRRANSTFRPSPGWDTDSSPRDGLASRNNRSIHKPSKGRAKIGFPYAARRPKDTPSCLGRLRALRKLKRPLRFPLQVLTLPLQKISHTQKGTS